MTYLIIIVVNGLIGLLIALCWHAQDGIGAMFYGLLLIVAVCGEIYWLTPSSPPSRSPLVYRPRDPSVGLDQHRADRQAHVTQLQRGFRTTKGRKA